MVDSITFFLEHGEILKSYFGGLGFFSRNSASEMHQKHSGNNIISIFKLSTKYSTILGYHFLP